MESIKFRDDENAIRGVMDKVLEAFNAGDIEKALLLHTDNVVLMESNMPAISGRQALHELFTSYFTKMRQQQVAAKLSFEILELEIMGNRAFARGKVELATAKNGDSKVQTGKFLCLFKKQEDGVWLRSHIVSNTDAPHIIEL